MKEIEHFEIDGLNFTTQEFDYDVGAPLFWRLLKLCGKGLMSFLFEGVSGLLSELSSGETTKEEAAKMDVMEIFQKLDRSKVVEAVDFFLQNIEPESMMSLTQKILQTTWIIDGNKERREINWKLDFKGKYGTSFKLLKHVLMLQYASVFQNVLSGIAETNKTEMKVVGKAVVAR